MAKHFADTLEAITAALSIHLNICQNSTVNTTAIIFTLEAAAFSSVFNRKILPLNGTELRIPSMFSATLNRSDTVLVRVSYSGSIVNELH